MTSDLTIRPYEATRDELAVLQLMASSLGWTDDPFFGDFFRWKHHYGPLGPSPAWVSVDGDRIVGFRALMRWQFLQSGRVVTAARTVDTATDPAYRGRGIFRDLTMHAVDRLSADGVDMVFNTPNDQSRPGYLKMGWEDVGRLPVLMQPTRVRRLLALRAARTAADLRSIPTDVGVPAVEGVDKAVVRTGGSDRLVTHRTPAYLRWRYGLAGLHYRAIVGQGGAAFFRLRRRGTAVECVVADLLVRDAEVARSAVRCLRRHSGADYLIGLGSDPQPIGGIPVPRQGPMLTWRALASSKRPAPEEFAVSMGDIELF